MLFFQVQPKSILQLIFCFREKAASAVKNLIDTSSRVAWECETKKVNVQFDFMPIG